MNARYFGAAIVAAAVLLSGCAGLSFGNNGYGIRLPPESHPMESASTDILPSTIRERLTQHLDARLGKAFQRKIHFERVHVVDPQRVGILRPRWRESPTFESHVPAYMISYRYVDAAKGLRAYYTRIGFGATGKVVREIGLPAVTAEPSKAEIISAKAAVRIAKGQDVKSDWIWFEYNAEIGSLMWVIGQHEPPNPMLPILSCRHVVEIDAHAGAVIRKSRQCGIV